MKTSRAAFLSAVVAVIVSVGVAYAAPGNRHGGGKKIVVNGTVSLVNDDAGVFVLHPKGGHGHAHAGPDVVVIVDENTSIVRSDGTQGSFFDDIAVGVKAKAKGKFDDKRRLRATSVLIKLDDSGDGGA